MKILQIAGVIVAVHLVAFTFVFFTPGCQSATRNIPTPKEAVSNVPPNASAVVYPTKTPQIYPEGNTAPPAGTNSTSVVTPSNFETSSLGSMSSDYAATTTPATPAHKTEPNSTYIVQSGDNLWNIAKRNHRSVAEFTKTNNLRNNSALYPGQKLTIPGQPGASRTPAISTVATMSTKAKRKRPVKRNTVIVKPGECLSTIAKRCGVKVSTLTKANGLTNRSMVYAGQKLTILDENDIKTATKLVVPRKSPTKTRENTSAAITPESEKIPTISTVPAPAQNQTPHFNAVFPLTDQNLDSGLKGNASSEVPTVKAEEPNK